METDIKKIPKMYIKCFESILSVVCLPSATKQGLEAKCHGGVVDPRRLCLSPLSAASEEGKHGLVIDFFL